MTADDIPKDAEGWHARRRRRLLFMLARYGLVIALVLVVGWLTGGFWLRGLALVATVLLVLRLVIFVYNGRRLEDRVARRQQRGGRP